MILSVFLKRNAEKCIMIINNNRLNNRNFIIDQNNRDYDFSIA
jgi:hypothetical protein